MFKLRRMLGVLCFHYFTVFLIIPSLIHTHPHTFNILFIFRERGRDGERAGEKHQCEREKSVGCLLHAPNQGPGPQPRPQP